MSTSQYAPDRSYGMFIDNQWVDAESGEEIRRLYRSEKLSQAAIAQHGRTIAPSRR